MMHKKSSVHSEQNLDHQMIGASALNDLNDDVVIRAVNLGKCYHIYDKPQDRSLDFSHFVLRMTKKFVDLLK